MPGIVLVIDGDAVRVVVSPIIPADEGLGAAPVGLRDRTTAAVRLVDGTVALFPLVPQWATG